MNIKDLKPANEHAQNFGVKAIIFGPAGCGKTPILNTAPRPVLLATEAGLLSMRGSTIPTYEAYTSQRIDEFFKRSEEHTSELQSPDHLVCRLLLEKKKKNKMNKSNGLGYLGTDNGVAAESK